jgi:modification methylase
MARVRLGASMARTGAAAAAPVRAADLTWADRVIHGDAGEVLDRLPEASVHLAVTSPPYNVGIRYQGYADDRSYEEYLRWLRGIGRSLYRVLVPGGRFALNVAPTSIKNFRPIHHDLARELQADSYILRTEIIWYKQTMGRRTAGGSWRSPANPHVIPSWEYVLVFSKESMRLDGDKAMIDIGAKEFQTISDGFWQIPPERNRRGHPAPFPWELIERLVRFYTYRANTVLDMFGGTGTVAAVARANGRHFISIDAAAEYCELALKRVATAAPTAPGRIFPAPDRVTESTELTGQRRQPRLRSPRTR